MKTALYIRVSTEEQAREGYSISAQTQKLKAFCVSQSWEVEGFYIDEGISAKDMERPELQRMLKDIELGKIECVLVYRLDRLTRSVFDLYKMLETFEKHDCKFKSATEVYDTTTAMGRMFITIVAALAQWERENMGERYSMAYAEKARQGKWPLNFAPLGYDLDKETSVLQINEKEAETVRNIHKLYRYYGMDSVSKILNDKKEFTKAGNVWTNVTIAKILKSHTYIGEIEWNGEVYNGLHEPIITKESWEQTQNLIKKRTTAPGRSVSSDYIFSGKLRCPECGRPMTGQKTVSSYKRKKTGEVIKYKHYQYRCRKKRDGACPGSRVVSELKLEEAFIDYIESFSFDDYIEEVAEVGKKKLDKVDEDNIDHEGVKKNLVKITNRKKKWQYAWTEDIMTDDDFKARMKEANEEEARLRLLLEKPKVEKRKYNETEIKNVLKDIRANWNVLEKKEKKYLVNSIVDRIHYRRIDNSQQVAIDKITFKVF